MKKTVAAGALLGVLAVAAPAGAADDRLRPNVSCNSANGGDHCTIAVAPAGLAITVRCIEPGGYRDAHIDDTNNHLGTPHRSNWWMPDNSACVFGYVNDPSDGPRAPLYRGRQLAATTRFS